MLLFWRKRKHGIVRAATSNSNAGNNTESTHDGRKTLILLIVLHVYIVLCAYGFQKIEYVEAKTEMPNLKAIAVNLSKQFNLTANESMGLIKKVIDAASIDREMYMTNSWGSFSKAFWFVTILFTTVGTGHIVPITVKGRLLAIVTALIGIPLYALFLKHFGECILYVNKKLLNLCSCLCGQSDTRKQTCKNTKIALIAFAEMMIIIFTGALGAFPFDWTYFEGIYFCFISLSTVGFGDMIPDISGDKAIYGIIYMFYNVVGLSFVSCFICSVVNLIDDFNAMRDAVQWATSTLRPSKQNGGQKSPKASKKADEINELCDINLEKQNLERNGSCVIENYAISVQSDEEKLCNVKKKEEAEKIKNVKF